MSQRIHFAALILKSSFNFIGTIMKCQKYSESEGLHEIGEVLSKLKELNGTFKMD